MLLTIIIGLCSAWPCHGEINTLLFSCPGEPDTPGAKYAAGIILSTTQKSAYKIVIEQIPLTKMKKLYSQNKLAGDCGRFLDFSTKNSLDNFEAISPAYRSANISLWATEDSAPLSKTARLAYLDSDLSIPNTAEKMNIGAPQGYKTVDAMITALHKNNVDYMLTWESLIHHKKSSLQEKGIYHHSLAYTLPVYIHIHKDYQPLKKLIRAEIIKQKNQKGYQQYSQESLPKRIEGKILFSCSISAKSPYFIKIKKLYTQIFSGLGYQFDMISLPRPREIKELLDGHIDGVCGQTKTLASLSKDISLIPVPISINPINIWATSPQSVDIDDITKIAYVRGSIDIEKELKARPNLKRIPVANPTAGLKMLVADRIPYFATSYFSTDNSIQNTNFNKSIYNVGVFSTTHIFPFLHKRHHKLNEPLKNSLEYQLKKHDEKTLLHLIK